jgi:hypothetical protein
VDQNILARLRIVDQGDIGFGPDSKGLKHSPVPVDFDNFQGNRHTHKKSLPVLIPALVVHHGMKD